MALASYSASAPGSLMLMGEHAVLAGKLALVTAIDKRINVILTPNTSNTIELIDANLGTMQLNIAEIRQQAPFEFVTAAIQYFEPQIKSGFTLQIRPDFSSKLGFGSSAAVTVATVAVLSAWLHAKQYGLKQLFKISKMIMLQVQGIGSGADIAASVYGGVLAYRVAPLKIIPLSLIPPITAVYCGYKKPTKMVVAMVKDLQQQQPKVFARIFSAMQTCVEQAMLAIRNSDWDSLGMLFMQHHGLQVALGVSDLQLDTLVRQLSAQSNIYGAKISGSGLGDCVIGLGTLASTVFPYDIGQRQQGVIQFALMVDPKGVAYGN
jgi:mevalonate kinase